MTPPRDDHTAAVGRVSNPTHPANQTSDPPEDHRPLATDLRPRLPLAVLHAALDILAAEWETDL